MPLTFPCCRVSQCKVTPDVLGMTDMLLQTPEAGLRSLLHAKPGNYCTQLRVSSLNTPLII